MPGGTPESYQILGPMLRAISAHVGDEPCCAWMGPNGAGHFVKMIHNGIEYSDMQVIGEAYELLRAAGIGTDEAAEIFAKWNEGELSSYLIEITADMLSQKDPQTGAPLVEVVKDRAGMKGTGTWTVMTALELGVPVNGIAESVFARALSSHDDLRAAATNLAGLIASSRCPTRRRSSKMSGRRCGRPRLWPTPRASTRSPAPAVSSSAGTSTSPTARRSGGTAASSGPSCSRTSARSTRPMQAWCP